MKSWSLFWLTMVVIFWAEQVFAQNVESYDSRETPVYVNGRKFTKIEIGNETFTVDLLKPDGSDPESVKCTKMDESKVSTALLTGSVRITKRNKLFIEALHAACKDGLYQGGIGAPKIGITLPTGDPNGERKIYTVPAGLPNLGFFSTW
jgi:hypothetical protein